MYDCIIVGAGPAGLSAALLLGRCRRRVLVCDTGRPRNAWSSAMHCFLSRDGIVPGEFLRIAREQLGPYPSVELRMVEVTDACQTESGFEVLLADGGREECRKLLVATGVLDELPQLEGLDALCGTCVHHCPYCDGWEHRDQPLAAYGREGRAYGLAVSLTVWSADVVLCSDGPAVLDATQRATLDALGIGVCEERIVRLEHRGGQLERIHFERGDPLERAALFFATSQRQHSSLAADLGARFLRRAPIVDTGPRETTNVPGLFVAGDASKDSQLVAIAVAEGAKAGFEINRELLEERLAALGVRTRTPSPAA